VKRKRASWCFNAGGYVDGLGICELEHWNETDYPNLDVDTPIVKALSTHTHIYIIFHSLSTADAS